jgi:2-aminoadipate transaminase
VKSSPVRDILALTEQPGVISFAGGLPAPELFDAPGLREAFAAALADEVAGRSLQYSTTEGDPALRAAVAARLTARGLPSEADQLLITSGSQQALTLIATVLLEPGRHRARGGAVLPRGVAGVPASPARPSCPVPCDDEGLDPTRSRCSPSATARACSTRSRRSRIRPGRTLPLDRREALVAAAQASPLLAAGGRPVRRAALLGRAAAAAGRAAGGR